MKEVWTSQLEISFIELVKQYEDLWNVNSKNYLKTKYKQRKFMEIGDVLEQLYPSHAQLFTPERLLKKFNMMKNYYRKACKLKEKTDNEHEICWVHFERMKFIDSKNNSESKSFEERSSEDSKKSSGSEDEEETRNVKTIIYNPDNDNVHFKIHQKVPIQKDPIPTQNQPKRQKTNSSTTPRTLTRSNPMGEQESLANFLGAKLFSVKDVAERHSLTMDILNTIHGYELRQTEREDQ